MGDRTAMRHRAMTDAVGNFCLALICPDCPEAHQISRVKGVSYCDPDLFLLKFYTIALN